VLIGAKANPNLKNKEGLNALMYASYKGFTDIVNALIGAKADVNLQNKEGITPLMYAIKNGHVDIVKALITYGSDIYLENKYGESAMSLAFNSGIREIITSIIDADIIYTSKQDIEINIDNNFDVCTISKYIKKIEGLQSKGVSSSDTWIVEFKNNIKFNNEPIKSGFLKIFIDTKNLDKTYNTPAKQALKYELNIYKNIISKLIKYKICPNFVKYLSSGENCSYKDLLNMLDKLRKNNGYYKNIMLCI